MGRVGALLLLLVILAGAGGYNYHRNYSAELEAAGVRPYERYSDNDLSALADAYRSEVEQYQKLRESQRPTIVRDRALLSDRVAEFERIQATSSKRRGLTSALARSQVQLDQIETEQAKRSQTRSGVELHLHRLITI